MRDAVPPAEPLAQEFSAGGLLRFVLPSLFMMVFMGLYTLTDTLFVARLVDTDALSAVNIVCPAIQLTVGLGTMLATGGSAVIARKMGAGQAQAARQDFTFLLFYGALAGVLLAAAGQVWCVPLLHLLGAEGRLFPYCLAYLRPLLLFAPACMLQVLFQNLFVTAGRPVLGFGLCAAAGCANILFDYLFLAVGQLGIAGAALGTGIGYLIPAAAGCWYFARSRGTLRLCRSRPDWPMLAESCRNGSSEMVGQLASAVTTFLFNRSMLRLAGEDGVAAVTILIYTQFLLSSVYLGFSIGVAPVISYSYGCRSSARLQKLLRTCLGFILVSSVLLFAAAFWGGRWLAALFAPSDAAVRALAGDGFRIFSFSFLFSGVNLFTSALFTALSDGRASALLAFTRTFGVLAPALVLLPRRFGLTGVWLAVPLAEGLAFLLAVLLLWRKREKYQYF